MSEENPTLDPIGYRCDGCGRLFRDPYADLSAIRAAGGRSCCPERKPVGLSDRIEELEVKLAKADKLASEFKNCLEVLTKEDDYVCCSGHQCGCYGASLHAQAIYYANEAIDDYHKTTGGKDE